MEIILFKRGPANTASLLKPKSLEQNAKASTIALLLWVIEKPFETLADAAYITSYDIASRPSEITNGMFL